MEVSEQARIFDEWLSQHKGLLFKVVHAYGFTNDRAPHRILHAAFWPSGKDMPITIADKNKDMGLH